MTLYTPLDSDLCQIRRLVLQPAVNFDDPLHSHLDVVSLESSPDFEALSYVWGSTTPAKTITLGDRLVTIGPNLDNALRNLRLLAAPRILWVDALCINQDDLDERASQVALMRRVYSDASTVLIWLGPEADGSEEAMRSVERFDKEYWQTYDFQAQFMEILFRPWFTRIWTVQEFAMAKHSVVDGRIKNPLFGCGNVWVEWLPFITAWAHFSDDRDVMQDKYKKAYHDAVVDTFRPEWIRTAHTRPIGTEQTSLEGVTTGLRSAFGENFLQNLSYHTVLEIAEIPQLQAHCKKLTEAGRSAACRRFLNSLLQLVLSLSLWSNNDETNVNLSDSQKAAEAGWLQKNVKELEETLDKAVGKCVMEMKDALTENIFEKFSEVIPLAVDQAPGIVTKWGSPVNKIDRAAGGLHFQTYKAVTRRNGVYGNKSGKSLSYSFQKNAKLTAKAINNLQRDANREFVPVIARNLAPSYQYCASERGAGMYMRMKDHLHAQIDQKRNFIFKESCDEVKRSLDKMCRRVEESMNNKTDEVYLLMRRDYLQVLNGAQVGGKIMPKWERHMRLQVARALETYEKDEADKAFNSVKEEESEETESLKENEAMKGFKVEELSDEKGDELVEGSEARNDELNVGAERDDTSEAIAVRNEHPADEETSNNEESETYREAPEIESSKMDIDAPAAEVSSTTLPPTEAASTEAVSTETTLTETSELPSA
ncbi:hypothetical protein ACHAQE_003816 [Botrytis cinerea]